MLARPEFCPCFDCVTEISSWDGLHPRRTSGDDRLQRGKAHLSVKYCGKVTGRGLLKNFKLNNIVEEMTIYHDGRFRDTKRPDRYHHRRHAIVGRNNRNDRVIRIDPMGYALDSSRIP